MSELRDIARTGLWENNPALVQLLGLCPLLAVSGTVTNALGLGLATTFVMVGANLTVSLIRDQIRDELRIPVYVLVIASLVTAVELLMHAYRHDLYKVLGIFIPLIVTNCAIIARVESFAAKNRPLPAAWDGLMMGLGFTAVLVLLGAMREALGQGTLLSRLDLLLGPAFRDLEIVLAEDYRGFLLAILPPGAFFGLALLVAAKNVIDQRRARRTRETAPQGDVAEAPSSL